MRESILFLTGDSRLDLYIRSGYENPEKYGIDVRQLTPRINKTNFGFSVRKDGRSYKGHISTQGDFIVRV